MMRKLKRLSCVLMCIAMMVTMLPTAVFATGTAPQPELLTGTADDEVQNNGVELTKNVSYDPATGKVTTTIEAYTTGKVTPQMLQSPLILSSCSIHRAVWHGLLPARVL